MSTLIACLSVGKGTWAHVTKLLGSSEWEQVFLITNEFGREKYSHDQEFEPIVIESNKDVAELSNDIKAALDGKIKDTEVAVNFMSGSGNEHMALISALLKLGLGIRLVVSEGDSFKEL